MTKQSMFKVILNYLQMVIGSAIYAAGFQFFTYPNAIPTGGVSGTAMILNMLTGVPVGMTIIVFNIPLFIFAWKKFGLKFIIASLTGMLCSSILFDVFNLLGIRATSELLLAAVYGGLIMGFGLGLLYSAGATTGGIDIAAKLLRRKFPYVNFGTIILVLDAIVIIAFALIFQKYDSSMYAIICMFIATKVIDLVLYGASNSKICHVITDASSEVKTAITQQLGRGVTLLHGEGAYSGKKKEVILCVIRQQQIADIRKIVREIDPTAFMFLSATNEVFGQGFLRIDDNT